MRRNWLKWIPGFRTKIKGPEPAAHEIAFNEIMDKARTESLYQAFVECRLSPLANVAPLIQRGLIREGYFGWVCTRPGDQARYAENFQKRLSSELGKVE